MTDPIIDLWYTLHMMGVPLDNHSYAFIREKWKITPKAQQATQ